jgi:hypothetical protein
LFITEGKKVAENPNSVFIFLHCDEFAEYILHQTIFIPHLKKKAAL